MLPKTVLITGASRGIGKAIALRFAREPYNIVITCIRNTDLLMETKAEIEAYRKTGLSDASVSDSTATASDDSFGSSPATAPDDSFGSGRSATATDGGFGSGRSATATDDGFGSGRSATATDDGFGSITVMPTSGGKNSLLSPGCLAYTGDMGDEACCEELFGQIRSRFGSVDVLVNNAGISYIGLLQDMTAEEWERVIRTNLTAPFHLCRLAIPGMVSRKSGKIINISSVWGNTGASCEAAYSASKGALNALTRALAKELAPSNIQVNAIACGAIDTEMNHFLDREELDNLISQIPAGRLGTPEEVADLVWKLTQHNAYLTGQVIGLDGGWI